MPSPLSFPAQTLIQALAGISLLAFICSEARAEEPLAGQGSDSTVRTAPTHGFYVNFGPGTLAFNAGATVKAAGTVIPGGTVKIGSNETLITEFGYRWGNIGMSLTGGYPPLATVEGAGSLSSLATLGRIRYGPTVLTAHYHFTQFGRFQPYVGAGPVFLLIFNNEDGAIRHLDVRDHVGAAVQFGAEYVVNRHWSLFFDVKKALLKTTATAYLGSAPIKADIRLNPTVLVGGLSYRF
ncbi:OmpW/AlkL family protein (plasmid) [Mesorhizobium sp. ORM8.1]